MAVFAMVMRDGTMEIAAFVALRAGCLRVLAEQRKLRIPVVKVRAGLILRPTSGGVTLLARSLHLGILKGSSVRIRVAILAARKRESLIARGFIAGLGIMTFLASYRLMLSGQREKRFRMTESGRGLPGVLRMTARAVSAKLASVLIFVTRDTFATQAQEGMIEIFHLDLGLGRCGNSIRRMASLALLFFMFAFQREACNSPVIERLPV